ncbi:DUF2283 domain-containing protein [Candidatus Falkowbacteria bacterium]|nr:DUF2283 domain-containing protein [Candidatus Falkowbacteria bacterium]
MQYDTESNIAWWELAADPIAQTKEFGNLIIHFSALGKPVLIEMLDASKFLGDFEKASASPKLKKFLSTLDTQ